MSSHKQRFYVHVKDRKGKGRPARKVLPPIQLTSPPKNSGSPKPPPVTPKAEEVPQVPIDAAFWRPLMLGLGTRPTGATKLKGATGVEHRVVEVGVDEARKRLVVFNDAADPMVAAFIQSDLQRAYTDQRVIVARTSLVNVDSSLRQSLKSNGAGSLKLKRLMEMVQKKEITEDTLKVVFGGPLQSIFGDPKVKNHSPGAFVQQLINQLTKLHWGNFATDAQDATLDSLLPGDEADIESQLGICTMPIYQVTADQVEKVKASTDLQPARELLLQLGVWGYFFPDSADLTLGLIDHGIDTEAGLEKAVALAPENGHLIAEKEEVPKLETVLADLHAKGLVAEVEAKLKVTVAGVRTRALVKLKPKESLFVKLKNLSGAIVPLAKLFFTGHP